MDRHHDQLVYLFKRLPLQFESTVLDIGAGFGAVAKALRPIAPHLQLFGNDPYRDEAKPLYDGWVTKPDGTEYDIVIACHVIEHVPNVQSFIHYMLASLRPDGLLVLVWPNPKVPTVGGHINLFYPGTMIYTLVMAGLDCGQDAVFATIGTYHMWAVRHRLRPASPPEHYDGFSLAELAPYFPFAPTQGFDGSAAGVQRLMAGKVSTPA